MDRRILKTRKIIKDSFIKLVDEIGFEKITVKNLTDMANINRGTFYLHYKDKYDFLEQSQNEVIEEMKNIIAPACNEIKTLLSLNNEVDIKPFLIELYTYLGKNSELLSAMLKCNNSLFIDEFKKMIQAYVGEIICNNKYINEKVKNKYLVEVIALIHIGVIEKWIDEGKVESPNEIATMLSVIINNLIKTLSS